MDIQLALLRLKRIETYIEDKGKVAKAVPKAVADEIDLIREIMYKHLDSDQQRLFEKIALPLKRNIGTLSYNIDDAMRLVGTLLDFSSIFIDNQIQEKAMPARILSKTLFIVHGHDELNLLKLRTILKERLGIDVKILSEEAGAGQTLIEKFESIASSVSYCIALMTPDDKIVIDNNFVYQARPNVIFEIGWFYGRLGRSRVCIISKKNVQLHSDLAGIMRIDFERSIEEVYIQIERELKKAQVA